MGIYTAHKKFGKLDFKEIVQPSIDLAAKGFPVTKSQASSFNYYKEIFTERNDYPIAFVKEEEWVEGDILQQPDLAHTLELIRDRGAAGLLRWSEIVS